MELTFKIKRVGCLGLSQACLILGILDLALNSYILAKMLVLVTRTDEVGPKFLLPLAIIGASTCFFMIMGSIQENHWSMLPHLVWQLILITTFVVIGVISLQNYVILDEHFQCDRVMNFVLFIIIIIDVPIILFLYWSIMYNRYCEIKEMHLLLSDQEQME